MSVVHSLLLLLQQLSLYLCLWVVLLLQRLLTCFPEGPSSQLLQQLLLWVEQQGDLLHAPLQVCVHLASLWQQQHLLLHSDSTDGSEGGGGATAAAGLQQKQQGAAGASSDGAAAVTAAAGAAEEQQPAAIPAAVSLGASEGDRDAAADDLLYLVILKILRVYRQLLHAVIDEADARVAADRLLLQQPQHPLLCFHTARNLLLKALLLLTAAPTQSGVGPDSVLLRRMQQQQRQQQQQHQGHTAAQGPLCLHLQQQQQQQQQQQMMPAAGAAAGSRDSAALLLQQLLPAPSLKWDLLLVGMHVVGEPLLFCFPVYKQ